MRNKRILTLIFVVAFLTLLAGCFPSPIEENQPPIITSDPVKTAKVGVTYIYDVNATDPEEDVLTYEVSGPSGMAINSTTGLISWKPSFAQVGDNDVTVVVSDGDLSVGQSFTIKVSKPSPTPIPTKYYTITATAGPNGSIDPSGKVKVKKGSDKTFTITPVSVFYGIVDVLVDGGSVGTGNSYTFTNVTANHTIEATFILLGRVYNQDKGKYYDTIQEAINDANPGDTILVALGTYNITSPLALNKANLTLKGEVGSKPKITTSGINWPFNISAPGVTLENFEIEKTDKGSAAPSHNIIYIGADNVTIKDNLIYGQYVMGDDEVSRAMEVAGGLTGLQIESNTIYSLRQPAYINAATGAISNNDVYNTRGWVIVSQSNLTFTNNTWGNGALPNYYDIAIVKDSPEGVNNYPDIVTMSEENNNAIIENQHSDYATPILSIVHVDADALVNVNGSILEPYDNISDAIPRVALGGTVHVAAGTYPENVEISQDKDGLQLLGSGSGVTSIAPISGRPVVLLGWDGLIDGFRIQGFTLVPAGASHAFLAGSGTADGSTCNKNLEFEDIVVDGGGRGIGLNAVQGVSFIDVHISNITGSPEAALELTGVSDLTFTGGSIEGNGIGVRLQPTGLGDVGESYGPNDNIQIHDSSLVGNTIAVENQDTTTTIDATDNWWGDTSGPTHYNNPGGTGDTVNGNVGYIPWSTSS